MSAIRERRTLCLVDLPKRLTSRRNLRAHFSKYGEVKNVSVNKDVRSAMVNFATHFDAQAAKTQGKFYNEKPLNIYWAENSSVDPRAGKVHKENPDMESDAAETVWEDDEKETFGVEFAPVKKNDGGKKSAENLIKSQLKLSGTGVKKRLGPLIKIGEDTKSKVLTSQKSPNKPSKVSPKSSVASKRNVLIQNKQKVLRKVGESVRSVINKPKRSLNIEDQSPKSVPTVAERTDLKMKLAQLDERDKSIRNKTKLDPNINTAVAIKGTCPDMCPERERIMRQFSMSVAAYEMFPGTYDMDENKAVKEYTRSSADQEVPLPHDLRPEPVLSMTMNYLITNIINKIDNPDENKAVWYSFCWNRLRSIRKDIILQQLCDMETVNIVEQCARFHICCYDHMWGAEVSGFDDKINTQNLIDCLQTLRHMYEDLAKHSIVCPNEPEFYSYLILLKLKSGDVMWEYQQYSLDIQLSREVQFAIQAYMAFKNNMYSRFFSIVKKASYLTSCLLQRYFDEVRTQALKTMLKAYCLPGKTVGLSSSFIVHSLKFDSQTNALRFCDRDEIELKVDSEKNKNDIYVSDSSFLIREKRLPIANAVVGENNSLPVYIPHQVHSMFDEFGRLKHSLFPEEEPEMSNEDSSDNIDTSHFSEQSLSMEECESEVSAASLPEVPVQQSGFKFSLSPTKSPQNVFGNIFFPSKVDEDHIKVGDDNCDSSPFKNSSLNNSNLFTFSTQPFENSELMKIEPEPNNAMVHESGKMKINEKFQLGFDQTTLQKSPNPVQQNFFSQSVFSPKTISEQWKQDEKQQEITTPNNSDVKSMFSFSSFTTDNSNKVHSKENSHYGNENKTNTFSFNFPEKIPNENKTHLSSFAFSTETSESKDSVPPLQQTIKPRPLESVQQDKATFGQKKKVRFTEEVEQTKKALILEKLLKEKAEEDKLRMEKIKREADERLKKEIEKQKVLQKLKKDLHVRLKADNARKYARLWKAKIAKLKQTRADFPTLIQLSVSDHLSRWGNVNSLPSNSIFQRAKNVKKFTAVTSQLLRSGITDSCRYLGLDLAEALAQAAAKSMRKGVVKPVFWKLSISVPWLTTSSSELSVFNQLMKRWCRQSFHKVETSLLGSVETIHTSLGFPVNISVHFSEDLQSSQNIQAMDALLFVVLNEAETEKMCLQRLRSLVLSEPRNGDFSVAVMNIGGVRFERVLRMELEELHEQNLVAHWSIKSWSSPTSILNSLHFLADHVTIVPNICASSLEMLIKEVSEEFFDALSSGQHLSYGLTEALKNPNNVIYLYNVCMTKLEDLLLSSKLEKYFNFAEEFKACIPLDESGGPELLCGKQYDEAYKSEISRKLSSLKLQEIQKWPPKSPKNLLKTLKTMCTELHDVNIFPQIVRMLDIPDDSDLAEHLQQISWLNVVEMFVQCKIRHSFSSKVKSKRLFVIFNKNDTTRLIQKQWWLQMPVVVQSEIC